ncbi:uncharacterized protein [Typha angustifolia]|uniref:uncharacterized protein n=1 Tax=Typha angustifolia TaxID=59011 RepID=UPI003C3065C1
MLLSGHGSGVGRIALQWNPHGVVAARLVPATRSAAAAFCSAPKPADHDSMEEAPPNPGQTKAAGDVMSHSFGEGYATRSDEEGFGGTYGGNDPDVNPGHRVNHPEYDKSQGSEVKEKEKARNLAHGAATAN